MWDPLRKKDVALTPEEEVRQWFIGVLNETMHIPLHMMRSEVSLNLGSKKFRADILVYDRKAEPLAVVECKRPETVLNGAVLEQAIRYNMALGVRYIMITNGSATMIFRRTAEGFAPVSGIPTYDEMTNGHGQGKD